MATPIHGDPIYDLTIQQAIHKNTMEAFERTGLFTDTHKVVHNLDKQTLIDLWVCGKKLGFSTQLLAKIEDYVVVRVEQGNKIVDARLIASKMLSDAFNKKLPPELF